jgi:hypothetical protein
VDALIEQLGAEAEAICLDQWEELRDPEEDF